MMIKSELIQAGYGFDVHHEGIQITEQAIQIQKDSNLDGDLDDPSEKVVYLFFPDEQKFSKKSGKGYFQILLEPIYSVFEAHSSDYETQGSPPCMRIQFQIEESDPIQESVLCTLNL